MVEKKVSIVFLFVGVILLVFSVKLPCISVFCDSTDYKLEIYPSIIVSIIFLILAILLYIIERKAGKIEE